MIRQLKNKEGEIQTMVKESEAFNERTIIINHQLIESNSELIMARDIINQETISSELKERKIDELTARIKVLEENLSNKNTIDDEVKKN